MESKQQIFVVGPPRSGTSIIARSIAAHAGGFVVTEVPLVTYFSDWFFEKKRLANFNRKTAVFNQFYNIDPFDFDSSLDFEGFYWTYMDHWSRDSNIIVDKNPFYAFQVRHILRNFPKAKILFVCRDSLATVNSHLQNEHKLGVDICFHAHLWNLFIEEYLILKKEFSDQLELMKYESFISDHNKELSRVLGVFQLDKNQDEIAVDQIVIKGKDDHQEFVSTLLEKVENIPNEERLNSWKENLTVSQQEQINSITVENRFALGYVDEIGKGTRCTKGYLKARLKVFKERLIYYLPIWLKDLIMKMK